MDSNKKIPLNKSDILYHLIKGWRVIAVSTLVGLIAGVALIGVGYIRGEVAKEYRITSSVAIVALNQNNQFTSRSDNPYKSDVEIARNITETSLYIFKSEKNMQDVIDKLSLKNVKAATLSNNLSLKRYEDTEVIEMTLMWRSEREGLEIMKNIIEVSDKSLINTLKIGRVSLINEPKASFIVGENIGISTWIYAAVVGLALGILLALLRFILATTVINSSDLEEIFGLDLLGNIPMDEDFAKKKKIENDDLPIRDDIISVTHMLMNRMERANIHRVYVTSTKHDEGRTLLLANIAFHMSELGKKVLLIDCDIKNPQLGALFKKQLKYEQTLNALYRGDSDKVDAVLHVNGCLDLLPVILEKNPDNFNDSMLHSIESVSEGYDFVLIDAAPIGLEAGVLRLNEITDAALFVVRCDFATVESIKKALLRISKSGAPVIGGIFNASSSWKDAFVRTQKHMEKLDPTMALERRAKKKEKKNKKKATKKKKFGEIDESSEE